MRFLNFKKSFIPWRWLEGKFCLFSSGLLGRHALVDVPMGLPVSNIRSTSYWVYRSTFAILKSKIPQGPVIVFSLKVTFLAATLLLLNLAMWQNFDKKH